MTSPSRIAAAVLASGLLALGIAACSSVPPTRVETYRCAGGQQFSLVLGGRNGAHLQWNDMGFAVDEESGRAGVYACEILTVWRDGRTAWLDLEGRPALRDCSRAQ